MKQIFTQAILIYSLFLCFGCSSKQTFYLNKGDSFAAYKKERHELTTGSNAVVAQLEEEKAVNGVSADASLFSASHQSFFQKRILPDNNESAKSLKSLPSKVFPEQKVPDPKQRVKIKFPATADNDKPDYKPANVGFTLGLGGILLALLGLFTGGAIPLLLGLIISIPGYITSKKALAKIKQRPEQYGGRELAIAGSVMSGLVLLSFVAFILYVLAFAGAFA